MQLEKINFTDKNQTKFKKLTQKSDEIQKNVKNVRTNK